MVIIQATAVIYYNVKATTPCLPVRETNLSVVDGELTQLRERNHLFVREAEAADFPMDNLLDQLEKTHERVLPVDERYRMT